MGVKKKDEKAVVIVEKMDVVNKGACYLMV